MRVRGLTGGGVRHPALRSVTRSAVGRADVGIGPYGGFHGVQGDIGWNYRVRLGMIWVGMKIWGLCFLYFYIIMKC